MAHPRKHPNLERLVQVLTAAALDGPWDHSVVARLHHRLVPSAYTRRFVLRLVKGFPAAPSLPTMAARIERLGRRLPRLRAVDLASSGMRPTPWEVPPLATFEDLARWLELESTALEVFVDRRQMRVRAPRGPLHPYAYRRLAKRDGSTRLIEAPKARLRAVQRQILRGVLDGVPPHDAAHGFRAGRSVHTFVARHVGQAIVARLDLHDFFGTITGTRVRAVYRALGYPPNVAFALAALCTNRLPHAYGGGPASAHLPQGAPTSPALANLVAYGLDVRLAGAAASYGAVYTRYADDLAFSGDAAFANRVPSFLALVGRIVGEEGFAVRPDKTRVLGQSQRQELAGVVVNQRPNVRRHDFDRLKAILHDAVKHGPIAANRDGHPDFQAHLAGRVAWVRSLNAERGERLFRLLNAIRWPG